MTFPVDLLMQCWFLAGPTASGKTAVSLCLADRIDAEVVAMDSMTLYRGMDIGTAKPPKHERSRVRHHLIDIVDPHEEFSVAEYLAAAEVVCREIISRGRRPLFVGGTGLYLRALLRGVFQGPSADWSIRRRLEELARSDGPLALHAQLARIDPASAQRLHPHDERRIIRALEVYEISGQPLSVLQRHGPRPIKERPPHVYWLSPPRDWLYQRIDARVEKMFDEGLLDEVQRLGELIQPLSHTARQALGYKEVFDCLATNPMRADSAFLTLNDGVSAEGPSEMIEIVQRRTRQFAKRQHTWFRNLDECHPICIAGDETPAAIADLMIQASNP